ncbi:unnamed protein product [Amaranthus hypochondriacus]
MSSVDFLELPEDCLSHILSLTSPTDVLRSSAVSKHLLTVSESDAVWEKFLPSDCHEIISRSCNPFQLSSSKKDLFLHLVRSPILLNNNTQSFGLDKRSGKKCYMLSARSLEIEWGDMLQYWDWISIPESRFPEVAELLDVCWLDIVGEIDTRLLTPNTTYGAYFVFKVDIDNFRGFNNPQMKVCASEFDKQGLSQNQLHSLQAVKQHYIQTPEGWIPRSEDSPIERDDGWMELEMGRYLVPGMGHGVDEGLILQMIFWEVKELHWKSGLVVQGIELRPLD